MSVKILSELVANQIAAGEVVERPGSVVKELVENALDAGAREISVVIIDGGRSLIQIIDDGCGMSPADAKLALQRFATSKLESVKDFDKLSTFGFRGEALPSIASVSSLSLDTSDGSARTKIALEGGKYVSESSIASDSASGTTITVRDLFFNVPARRSFLKSERSELSLIKAIVLDFAVSRPEVRFTLVVDGQTSLTLPAKKSSGSFDSFIERVRDLRLSSSDLLECSAALETPSGVYRVFAGLTKPLDCVSGAARLRLLVNGRGVRDKILLRAVRDAYGTFLRADKFPVGVVKLEVPPLDLDVNVHPQKAEIRFRAPERVFTVTRQAVGVALRDVAAVSRGEGIVSGPSDAFSSTPPFYGSGRFDRPNLPVPSAFSFQMPSAAKELRDVFSPTVAVSRESESLQNSRYVGQIFQCYLLFERAPESFLIVDMHAAHERITFARLKKLWSEGDSLSQQLLIPEMISFPEHLLAEEEELINLLEALGFEISKLHNNQFAVRAVPEILARVSPRNLVADLFSELTLQDLQGALERKVDSVLNRLSCHASVRSGQSLAEAEAYKLLEDLESTELRAFCPHGRSVARELTKSDLEKLFGRSE